MCTEEFEVNGYKATVLIPDPPEREMDMENGVFYCEIAFERVGKKLNFELEQAGKIKILS